MSRSSSSKPHVLKRVIPNALTIARGLLALPFAYFLANQQFEYATIIYLVALISDLDGVLARRWGTTTKFGAVADPTVDALYVVIGLSLLSWYGRVIPLLAGAYLVSALVRLIPSISHLKATQTVLSTRLSKGIAVCGFGAVFFGTYGAPTAFTSVLLLAGFLGNTGLTAYWLDSGRFMLKRK